MSFSRVLNIDVNCCGRVCWWHTEKRFRIGYLGTLATHWQNKENGAHMEDLFLINIRHHALQFYKVVRFSTRFLGMVLVLRSAVDMTDVLRSGLVMGYAT